MNKKEHWDRIYADRAPTEVSWYEAEPEVSLELIQAAGISKEASIIDVGGGAAELAGRLLSAGYANVAVLDISANALNHAKKRLGTMAAKVEWFVGDVTEFAPPHTFDLWHDRAVFHFLTDPEERKKYVEVLHATVASGGQVIIAAFAMDGPKRCSGLDIVQYSSELLSDELNSGEPGRGFELVGEQTKVHRTPEGKEQSFKYFRFIKKS
jgi:SAM-dependent methyltransferase